MNIKTLGRKDLCIAAMVFACIVMATVEYVQSDELLQYSVLTRGIQG